MRNVSCMWRDGDGGEGEIERMSRSRFEDLSAGESGDGSPAACYTRGHVQVIETGRYSLDLVDLKREKR